MIPPTTEVLGVSVTYIFHATVFYSVVINNILTSQLILSWVNLWVGFNYSFLLKLPLFMYLTTTQLNDPFIELNLLTTFFLSYDYNYSATSYSGKIFSLISNNYVFLQQFFPVDYFTFFTSFIFDKSLLPLFICFFCWYNLIIIYMSHNYILEK